jgi:hypothetical protein
MLRVAGGGIGVANGAQVLAKSAVAASCPADTTEDILATIPIPAGAMGANGFIRVSTRWSMTNNANVKTLFVRFSGAAGTAYLNTAISSVGEAFYLVDIANRNSASSQVGGTFGVAGASAVKGSATAVTSAENTALATSIVISGQKATAGDTLTLESYLVELMYGA